MKSQSIQKKLSLSYILFILLFVLFIAILSNLLIENQFKHYTAKKQTGQMAQIVNQVVKQYDNTWNTNNLEVISNIALEQGYIMAVTSTDGSTVFDATIHNGHQCEMVIEDIEHRMKENFNNWDGEYVTSTFPIYMQDKNIGNVKLGYFSPYFYMEEDLAFLTSLNTLYLYSSILFIIVALLLAGTMAKRLANPLERVVKTTENIARGIYESLPEDDTRIREINQLTRSMNQLSMTLKNQEQLRKQLTDDVTHELRTPLTTLQTHIEGLIEGILEVDQSQLNSIYEEILRLNKIVSDLDQLSSFEIESVQLSKEMTNIGTLIENVVNLYKVPFVQQEINLSYNKKDVTLFIDKDKMSQVFTNIISNALKYTIEGSVMISINKEPGKVIISIKDTGIGISEEELPHIFERFYRADKSRARISGGAGIGLAIVKSIIKAHNGEIVVSSQLGVGTEFKVILPHL